MNQHLLPEIDQAKLKLEPVVRILSSVRRNDWEFDKRFELVQVLVQEEDEEKD